MSALTVITGTGQDVRIVPLPMIRRRRVLPVPVSGFLGWMAAALGVYSIAFLSHGPLRAVAAPVAVARIAVITAIGAVFARAVRGASAELILATGLGWLVLSIAADLITGIGSAGAYQLLGDPTPVSGILRNVTILAWLSAPALFAWGGAPIERREGFGRHR